MRVSSVARRELPKRVGQHSNERQQHMSQILTVELKDVVFDAIQRQAKATGASPAQVAGAALERSFLSPHGKIDTRSEVEKQAARERFERHIGEISVGTGADNESIDADLAREYASTHEDE